MTMVRILVVAATLFSSALGQTVTSSAPQTATSTPMLGSLPGEEITQEIMKALETCSPALYDLVTSTEENTSGSGGTTSTTSTTTTTTTTGSDPSSEILAQFNSYFTEIAQDTCDDSEKATLMSALGDFKTCTGGLDMMKFITYMPSALMGGAIKCLMGISAEGDLFSLETYASEGLPEDCNEAFMGSNPFGEMIRISMLKPDVVFKCLADLGDAVPSCRYYSWPMPVVGSWLKSGACFVGSLTGLLDLICEAELTGLESCLSNQQDICAAQEGCKEDSISMNLMPPFLGAPLPDTCLRVANEKGLQNGVTLYDNFREQCTSPWDGWNTPIGASTA